MTLHALLLLVLLAVKHLVCDGPLQSAAMVRNKGIFLNWTGMLHSIYHAMGTFFMVLIATAVFAQDGFQNLLALASILALLDLLIHYTVDYTKVNVGDKHGWSRLHTLPEGTTGVLVTNVRFWWAFVADQCAHFATYALLAYLYFAL